MTERKSSDGQIDQLVKARWLEIGLSQADLVEVLDAGFEHPRNNSDVGIDRLLRIAEALDMPLHYFSDAKTRPVEPGRSSAQSLLELRLLQAFHELPTQDTRRMLVELAERIVKRQA
jgi:hypothetical protein